MDVMKVVHHLTYEHIGDEPLEDLQGLCRPCHDYLSAEADVDPADRVMYTLGFIHLAKAGVTREALDRAIRRTAGWPTIDGPVSEQVENEIADYFWGEVEHGLEEA